MEDVEKSEHGMGSQLHEQISAGNGAPLSRAMTVTLSDEQYERLFFQPSAPRRGDLAKRFGTFSHESASISIS